MRHLFRALLISLPLMFLAGCATYGAGVNGAIVDAQQGKYEESAAKIEKALSPTGNDRLLYNLELGMVRYLEGKYAESNQLLESAERIAEDLETRRVGDELAVLMTNPRLGPYPGAEFERVLINYYKSLNYLALAEQSTTRNERLDNLEAARVEARRIIIKLNDINSRKGNYQQKKDKDERTFSKIMKVFNLLLGNFVDTDDWQYRDDALAHYMAGVSFEMNGEYDDARISYQKAAEAYEGGYAKQYFLDSSITDQAWFDVVRMMRRAGGYDNEWRALAEKKLSEKQRAELDDWGADKAQLIVLEDKGIAPQRKEMNLEMSVNPHIRSLSLSPYFIGTDSDELAWFYVLYADKSLYGLVTAYLNVSRATFKPIFFTKTVPLGPLWSQAESIGLISAIGNSLRVTVPYYSRPQHEGPSQLQVGNEKLPLLEASSPGMIAVQEQLVNAGEDIRAALARAAFKALTAQTATNALTGNSGNGSSGDGGQALLSFAGKLLMQLTDAAETRNWLLLPNEIRLRRVALEPGEHQLELVSDKTTGGQQVHREQVNLQTGDIHLWRVRTFDGVKPQGK
ncbi:MAG: hypothetical protein CMI08_10805 [Oceanospirillaceae bacterium]|uniref:hypothetical protein n=2 Tax=unclassified Thalassolituus TaxID=2624967 RepID=UPI000C5F331B|nr:hypothetical protein [Thalassolituus sp. UBA6592]MAX99669.1 hypothetical protein [Oceanospirillaceae bacterium]MBL35418.1 hypothetical protein [Oceanospirillaceae bacterium]MBS51899.1 hypothetical protein [Oceanospirillaceae bacterium]|tara:strand:- start:905 stop:2611 length:1707 start_codon:yes stop_codon:yes gene_type:complete